MVAPSLRPPTAFAWLAVAHHGTIQRIMDVALANTDTAKEPTSAVMAE